MSPLARVGACWPSLGIGCAPRMISDPDQLPRRENNMFLRLIRTTSFRFALITVSLFMMSVMMLGAFSYRATIGAAIGGVETQINNEFDNLQKIYTVAGFASLRGSVKLRASSENRLLFNPYSSDSLYIFIEAQTKELPVRDLEEVPAAALQTDDMVEFEYRRDRRSLDNSLLEPDGFETRYAIGRIEKFYNPVTNELEALIFLARDITDLVSIRASARGVMRPPRSPLIEARLPSGRAPPAYLPVSSPAASGE